MTLTASIEEAAARMNGTAYDVIELSRIHPATDNVRRSVGDIDGLVESIKAQGILEPLIVVPLDGTEDFTIVAGHRRYAAAAKAGLTDAPCIVRTDMTDGARLEAMLVENLQRHDLTPLEEAEGFRRLVELGMSQADVARKVGCKQPQVSKRLSLLELPTSAQKALDAGGINVAGALAMLKAKDHPAVIEAVVKALGKLKKGEPAIEAGEVEWKLEQLTAEADLKAKIAKLRGDIKTKGWAQVQPPKYGDKHAWCPIQRGKYAYSGELELDVKAHRKEACHGAYVAESYRSADLVEVCVDPSRHGGKGDSALKLPTKAKAATKKTPTELKAAEEQRAAREASKRRTAFLQVNLSGRIDKGQALVVVATQIIHEAHHETIVQACKFLDLEPRERKERYMSGKDYLGPITELSAKSELDCLRVGLAIALAAGETGVPRAKADPLIANAKQSWSDRAGAVGRLFGTLISLGYEPDAFELKKFAKEIRAARGEAEPAPPAKKAKAPRKSRAANQADAEARGRQRLAEIEISLLSCDALSRLQLIQERMTLREQLGIAPDVDEGDSLADRAAELESRWNELGEQLDDEELDESRRTALQSERDAVEAELAAL